MTTMERLKAEQAALDTALCHTSYGDPRYAEIFEMYAFISDCIRSAPPTRQQKEAARDGNHEAARV